MFVTYKVLQSLGIRYFQNKFRMPDSACLGLGTATPDSIAIADKMKSLKPEANRFFQRDHLYASVHKLYLFLGFVCTIY